MDSVKKYVAAGVPSMFGFFGYTSFDSGDQPGHIPLPTDEELAGDPEWGHAIVAVGYNDTRKITNSKNNVTTERRLPHPQLVGNRMGRQRLWLDALRLRTPGACHGLLVVVEDGVGGY